MRRATFASISRFLDESCNLTATTVSISMRHSFAATRLPTGMSLVMHVRHNSAPFVRGLAGAVQRVPIVRTKALAADFDAEASGRINTNGFCCDAVFI